MNDNLTSYPLAEVFKSYQGEGANLGRESIFVRFAYCNRACSWCDTDYSEKAIYTTQELISMLEKWSCKSVILTGGEPTLQPLTPFLMELKRCGYYIMMETNGNHSVKEYRAYIDHITVSPKDKKIAIEVCEELRLVNDKQTVESCLYFEKTIEAKYYYLSPLELNGEMNIQKTLELLNKVNAVSKKQWKLSVQTHKLFGFK